MCASSSGAGPKLLVSEGQVLTTSGILKGNHLALQVGVQARSTYGTLTMLISICIGLKSFQHGQISLVWYGVVNGILPSNAHFAGASALY